MRYLLAATLVLIAMPAYAQVSCQRIGQFTNCSDGTSMNQIGNTMYINPPAYTPQPIYQPPVYQAPQVYVPPTPLILQQPRRSW